MEQYIAIGQIVKPQGIRGEVKVIPMTDDANRFIGLDEVYVGADAHIGPHDNLRVLSASVRGDFVYLTLNGIADRSAAESLRGKYIYVERSEAVPLTNGQAFICDIIGCKLVYEDGSEAGAITDVIKTGANDVFEVDTPRGKLLVPVIESVVLEMKPEDGVVIVDRTRLGETSVYI